MGGLPASGLVRLVVDDSDYEKARQAIDRWEAAERESPPAPVQYVPLRKSRRMLAGLVGLVLGCAATYAYMRVPVSVNGVDHNRDGILDEQWILSPSGATVEIRVDRNLDGKIDYVIHYDQRGQMEKAEGDDDFDGKFESQYRFRYGNLVSSQIDTDGDGFPDLTSYFEHGVIQTSKFINPKTGMPLRVEHFHLGRVDYAEVDSDKDGGLDKRITYSTSGEITQTRNVTRP